MYRICFLLIFVLSSLISKDLEKVSLQLNWKYQFEFAGFIAAKEKGFYDEVGLDVDIKEYKPGSSVLDDIKNNKTTYGIYDLSLLHLKDKEKPIKLIANYFKRSALVFVTTQDIVTPEDLRNRTIMADKQQLVSSTLNTLLEKFDIKKNDYIFNQHTFTPDDFISGKVDIMSAYLSNELYDIRKSKKPYNIIDPLSYGIYGSGVNVFTTEEETIKNPNRVKKFIEASNKGWVYALKNKKELVEIIYNKYSTIKSKEALIFEANQTDKLIMPNIYNIGEINKILIQRNINDFATEGMLDDKFDVDSIIFDNQKKQPKDLSFTKEQIEYINQKREITMCIDPDWMPYEKIQNGKHIGMTSEYMPLISEKLDIPIRLIPTKNWTQSIEYAKQRKCDIYSLAMSTPERLKYMNFTMPYISFPLVLATKMDKFFISNPEKLITKEEIGIVKGYSVGELLKHRYPNHKIIDVNSVDEGMQMLEEGKLYGFIGALPTVVYSIQYNYIGELKIAGKFNNNLELSIGVRNDDLILFELLQKAVKSIEEVKKQEILNKYISVKIDSGVDYKLLYQVLAILFVITLLGFYRHRQVLKYNIELEKKQIELQDTQKRLQDSLNGFEILLDSVLEAVFVFENRVCIDINIVALKMFGYESKEEVLGKHIKDFVTKNSYITVLKKIQLKDNSPYELIAIKKNKKEFNVVVKGTDAIIDLKKVRISGVVDITELKNKENLLFQQSKMASMGQMLENIAHQWRQPLSAISSVTTALQLKKDLDLVSKDEEIEDLKKINNSAQHLSQTIEDFRNFFKVDKKIVEFSVLNTIEKNFKLLEGVIKNADIQVVFENKDDALISSYENEFTQALINLIYNAKDAMYKKDFKKYIFINLEKNDEFITIKIKDSGGGINSDIIKNIFEPYFTTKHKSQGTGIGLYMTHQIIQKHMRGTISAENLSYKYKNYTLTGAQFIINLPYKIDID